MRIVVAIKQVPSSETKVRISTQTGRVDTSEVEWVINPYDEYALETALRIREQQGAGTVTAVTFGPERARTALKTALSMGLDAALHVDDAGVACADPLAVGRVLAAAVKQAGFDLALCGKQAIDDDLAFVPQALAHFLDVPHVAVVPELSVEGGAVVCHREIEGATEVVRAPLPCLVTIQKGKLEPRYPTLKLMMAAKRKDIPVLKVPDLGIDPATLACTVESTGDRLPPGRKPGRKLDGEPQQAVTELVRLLHEEAKVL